MPIDPEIRRAWTLPSAVYTDPRSFDLQRERVFARSWQLVAGAERAARAGDTLPLVLLEGCLDEPLALCRDEARLHCLSNVCTHRGALVVEREGSAKVLRCRYHGRRYGLDGQFLSMPEFDGVEHFPAPGDSLPRLSLERWGPLHFVALAPPCPFAEWIEPIRRRVDWLPLDRLELDPASSRDYTVRAHWALYVDNYLEGFHIPYVHGGLADVIDYDSYTTELYRWSSLQVGTARGGDAVFELPAAHPDHGQAVAAYYAWLFPNLMLNFYPWGLSLNLVEPRGVAETRVRFLSYVWERGASRAGAGADLHRVEMEDEEVVESVQQGVRSRLYDRGRYSPAREAGVHHFHRLLVQALGQPGDERVPLP
ncbi:MAG TPA: SRPBCC family protein [Candidatus Polarisedimenticolaceae bacterium]|nr:SRPBCC family protein [Candidatus Polarisedimenticolaceae bacterium]